MVVRSRAGRLDRARGSRVLMPGDDGRLVRRAPARIGARHRAGESWREWISSLVNTLRRCHSTVRGLRKSRAPISGFDSPSRASCAMCRSCEVSSSRISTIRLRAFPPVAEELRTCALGERVHPHRRELVVRGAELGARVDSAVLAAQPLAVEQDASGRDPHAASCVAGARRPPGSAPPRRDPRSPALATVPRRRGPSRCPRVASSPSAARPHRARRRPLRYVRPTRPAPAATTSRQTCRAARRWLPPPPRARPRSGRGRCRGSRPPSARSSPRCPAARPSTCSIVRSIRLTASASRPRIARTSISVYGGRRVPVASVIALASAMCEAAAAKSPPRAAAVPRASRIGGN